MSQHWYDIDGNPVYTIIGTNGKERATTLRDAKKYGYVPSVTTITSLLAKPGLEIWKQEKLLEASKYIDRNLCLDFYQYKNEVLQQYKSELEKAPKLGSDVHDELEQWYKLGANTSPGNRISKTVFAIREQIGKYDYISEQSFYCPYGFGGKIDLNYQDIIIDFKTKNTNDSKKMIKTFDYAMQLAAYREGLNYKKARCYNVYISTVDFNIVEVVKYTEDELQSAWLAFKSLLTVWKSMNGIKEITNVI